MSADGISNIVALCILSFYFSLASAIMFERVDTYIIEALSFLIHRAGYRLQWAPTAEALIAQVLNVRKVVGCLLLHGRGYTPQWSLYAVAATSMLLYTLPLVALPRFRVDHLKLQHRKTILGLSRSSHIAATLAETKTWPLHLLLQRRLHVVDRVHYTQDIRLGAHG